MEKLQDSEETDIAFRDTVTTESTFHLTITFFHQSNLANWQVFLRLKFLSRLSLCLIACVPPIFQYSTPVPKNV